ncbi:hypothetical protein [Paracraurococcus lichenis]|uniref:Uncharacterized protein n=1 Tax=Paracraurococcus lichenis TaxID=3064888 RepID=A0ABT9ED01_9PROT|nr:hypothetical protein [Paracraurococcus sp. LOR1-02]MDO9713760.1 hypothetical protein [Paracraurococcus sp. LOR1-02]
MRDPLDTDVLEHLAVVMAEAEDARRATQATRARAAATRARAVEVRLIAQHERARTAALQELRWHRGGQQGTRAT